MARFGVGLPDFMAGGSMRIAPPPEGGVSLKDKLKMNTILIIVGLILTFLASVAIIKSII